MENLLISACLLGVQCRYDGGSKPVMPTVALMEQYHLIPICPEQLGGLPTPREPSERRGGHRRLKIRRGRDRAVSPRGGAGAASGPALRLQSGRPERAQPELRQRRGLRRHVLRRLTPGDGVTAALLKANGIAVYGESDLDALLQPEPPAEEDAQRSLF